MNRFRNLIRPASPRAHKWYLTREAILTEVGPSRLSFWTIVAIALLLVGLLVWAQAVTITTAAKADGAAMPTGDERVVQHLEGGIVRAIEVHDGDLVHTGDVLIAFDPTLRKAELEQVRAREASLTIREKRLRAFIDGSEPDYSDLAGKYPDLVGEATFALKAVRERVAGQQAVLQSRIDQRRKAIDVYLKQAAGLEKQRNLLQQVVDMRSSLFKSGHEARVNLIASQIELAKVQSALNEAQVSAEQADSAALEAENQLTELSVTERGKALEELTGVLSDLAEVRENLLRLQDRVKRLDVLAPVNGIVHNMRVNTPGAVVEPAQVLMTIVPIDEKLIVEARIKPSDIGYLAVGQPAKVTVAGFDARRYGTLPGTLTKISATTFSTEKGEPFFKGQITLDTSVIKGGAATYKVVPGMTVQVDIVTGTQSLLQYLTGPVYKALVGSFSER